MRSIKKEALCGSFFLLSLDATLLAQLELRARWLTIPDEIRTLAIGLNLNFGRIEWHSPLCETP